MYAINGNRMHVQPTSKNWVKFERYFTSRWRNFIFLVSAGPTITPSVDVAKCTTKSYNIQFRYETEEELEFQLQREYGNVNICTL